MFPIDFAIHFINAQRITYVIFSSLNIRNPILVA